MAFNGIQWHSMVPNDASGSVYASFLAVARLSCLTYSSHFMQLWRRKSWSPQCLHTGSGKSDENPWSSAVIRYFNAHQSDDKCIQNPIKPYKSWDKPPINCCRISLAHPQDGFTRPLAGRKPVLVHRRQRHAEFHPRGSIGIAIETWDGAT